MSETVQRVAQLSSERRLLLQKLLRERAGNRPASREIPRREGSGPVPLSYAQQRLWFIDQLNPGSATYNMFHTLRLRGELDVDALERSFTELVRRHEVLRTRFEARDGEPVQVVEPPAPVPLPVMDLRSLDAEAREAEAHRLARAEVRVPFDLTRGPLFRSTLLRLGDAEYALLFCMHHVASDGWSTGVLVRELGQLYDAFAAGRAPALPELPLQYADYAAWQREWLTDEVLGRQIGWWRARLAGAPPLLEIPTDRPRAPDRSQQSDGVTVVIAAEVASALRELSQREGATLFMTLLAAWQAVLARHGGQDDVVVGTPISGRPRVELEGLVGLFINMLPLRTDLSGDPTFRELLGRVRETTLGAYAHQDLPFEKLVEALGVERSLNHAPLFQVGFAVHRVEASDQVVLGGIRGEPFGEGSPNIPLNLNLRILDRGDRFSAVLAYQTALFDAATMERMAGHFRLLVEAVAAEPDRPLSSIELLSAEEREQVVDSWNRTALAVPPGSLDAAFAAQAARTPDAVAVLCGDESLTYAALDERAGQLAHHLRALGVGPEVRVGLCLERGVELMVGLLAVWKAGGAYVPLDPGYPAGRLAYMLADSGARILLTRRGVAAPPLPAGVARVDVDDVPRCAAAALESGTGARSAAYVIYTSGSTGRPKGVVVEHGSVLNLAAALEAGIYGAGGGTRVSMNGSAAFDTSVKQIVQLLRGATLCILPEAVRYDADAMGTYLRAHAVEVLDCTPAQLRHLLAGGVLEKAGPALRALLVGGEAVEPALWRRLGELEGVRAWNLYGPTECTVDAALRRVSGESPRLGGPVANARLYVLDGAGLPVPVGVPGELHVGGAGVARGYLGRPALTAEKFVPDPFGAEPGARMYRTGDRARWTAQGEVEFLGRVDAQVKVRGFRIEPGEIEAGLRAHAAVREAVVVARADAAGEARLVAYVVAGEVTAAELREWLRGSLPEYMVPAAYVALDALPLTPSGKLDRRALPEPQAEGAAGTYVAPRDAAELLLSRIWTEVLGVRAVGVRDDFFALGGHSLLAVRMLARVERETGTRIPVAPLFAGATIERLAELLRRDPGTVDDGVLVPLQPAGGRAPLFLVHAAGGSILPYLPLIRHLPPDQPVYGLQARGVAGGAPPAASVDEMAADYLEAIVAAHPHGPYRLAGWSMGGAVAHEVAGRLRERGATVEALVLIDTHLAAGEAPDEVAQLASFARQLGIPPERLAGETRDAVLALPPGAQLERVRQAARDAGVLPPELDDGTLERLYAVYRAHSAALRGWTPAPYDGPLTLLRASEGAGASADAGWGSASERRIPGDHFSLLREPHVHALAAALATLEGAS